MSWFVIIQFFFLWVLAVSRIINLCQAHFEFVFVWFQAIFIYMDILTFEDPLSRAGACHSLRILEVISFYCFYNCVVGLARTLFILHYIHLAFHSTLLLHLTIYLLEVLILLAPVTLIVLNTLIFVKTYFSLLLCYLFYSPLLCILLAFYSTLLLHLTTYLSSWSANSAGFGNINSFKYLNICKDIL